jgi:adenylate kinase
VLRAAVKAGTPMGLAAKAAMERGDLVPDDVILGIVRDALANDAKNGAILDGVVRTVGQAEGLRATLTSLGRAVDVILLFEAGTEELVKRLSGRTTCENCQTPYTGREPGTPCDKCGGKLIRRADDDPASVRRRMEAYRQKTAPVIEWSRASGARMETVDALGTLAACTARARAALNGKAR